MRIRVTTRADLFEKRKQQHIERGYRIEDKRPIPVNGFCSFIAVTELPASAGLTELVAQAFNGNHGGRRGFVRHAMSLRARFRFDGKCSLHPRYDPAREGRPQREKCEGCESLYVINLYTRIGKKRAEDSNCIVARVSRGREEQPATNDASQGSETELD